MTTDASLYRPIANKVLFSPLTSVDIVTTSKPFQSIFSQSTRESIESVSSEECGVVENSVFCETPVHTDMSKTSVNDRLFFYLYIIYQSHTDVGRWADERDDEDEDEEVSVKPLHVANNAHKYPIPREVSSSFQYRTASDRRSDVRRPINTKQQKQSSIGNESIVLFKH